MYQPYMFQHQWAQRCNWVTSLYLINITSTNMLTVSCAARWWDLVVRFPTCSWSLNYLWSQPMTITFLHGEMSKWFYCGWCCKKSVHGLHYYSLRLGSRQVVFRMLAHGLFLWSIIEHPVYLKFSSLELLCRHMVLLAKFSEGDFHHGRIIKCLKAFVYTWQTRNRKNCSEMEWNCIGDEENCG